MIRLVVVCFFFFFFKQKTAYEMRISDWSSDVCSSDLLVRIEMAKGRLAARRQQKVVHADAILDNFEHRARAVRPQAVARGQPDRLLIIEGSAVRQRLAGVVGHEGDHVADLPAPRVDYLEDFTAPKNEQIGRAACRGRVCK